jgi:glutaredoxin
MNLFEIFFSSLGLSWTLSKALPYILFLIIGFSFSVIFYKKLKLLKLLKLIISLAIFVLPFLVYFVYSPIYQGDFSNSGYIVSSENRFPDKKQLTVYVLSNCPYCIQATTTLKNMLFNNKRIHLEIKVIGNHMNDKIKYQRLINQLGDVSLYKKSDSLLREPIKAMLKLTEGEFPTYVLSESGQAVKAWHNDRFGVRAMDEIDQFFRK